MSRYKIEIDNAEYDVEILEDKGDEVRVVVNDREVLVSVRAGSGTVAGTPAARPPVASSPVPAAAVPAPAAPVPGAAPGEVRAPMPALVTEVLVKAGDHVDAGQVLLKIEAMKMENQVCSPSTGTVEEICTSSGRDVKEGELLVRIKPD